jgi:hypothetical protein
MAAPVTHLPRPASAGKPRIGDAIAGYDGYGGLDGDTITQSDVPSDICHPSKHRNCCSSAPAAACKLDPLRHAPEP